jgi:lactobin A/cerein 7B family class IIb bacteriocin
MEYNKMRELNKNEIQEVNGGLWQYVIGAAGVIIAAWIGTSGSSGPTATYNGNTASCESGQTAVANSSGAYCLNP